MNKKFIDIARKTDDAYKIGEVPEGYIEYYPAYTDSETGTQVKFLQKKGTNILEIRWAGTNFSDHDGYRGFADVLYGWRTKAKVTFDKVDMEILSWLIPGAKNKGMRIYSYGDSLGGLNTGHTIQKYPYVESGMTNTSNIWETDTNPVFQTIMPLFSPYSKKSEYKGLASSYHIRVHGELLGDTGGLPANALTVERASTQGFTRLWVEETIKKYPILNYNPFFQLNPWSLGIRAGIHGSQGASAHTEREILTADNGEPFHPVGELNNIQLYYDKYPHKIPEYIKGIDKVLDGDIVGGSKIVFDELVKGTKVFAQEKKEEISLKINNTLIATQKEVNEKIVPASRHSVEVINSNPLADTITGGMSDSAPMLAGQLLNAFLPKEKKVIKVQVYYYGDEPFYREIGTDNYYKNNGSVDFEMDTSGDYPDVYKREYSNPGHERREKIKAELKDKFVVPYAGRGDGTKSGVWNNHTRSSYMTDETAQKIDTARELRVVESNEIVEEVELVPGVKKITYGNGRVEHQNNVFEMPRD